MSSPANRTSPKFPDDLPALQNPKRLAALEKTELLDSPPEAAFDRYTHIVSKLLTCPISMISLVDKDRQFFKSIAGMSGPIAEARQTPLSQSFCKYVVQSQSSLVIENAEADPELREHAAFRENGVVAYLGMPLTTESGETLGALCAVDVKPHEWSNETVEMMRELSSMVMTEIELRKVGRELRDAYQQVTALEKQRDELVHMLVHDLRNPLGSLISALSLIDTGGLDEDQREALMIAQVSGERLLGMLGDILTVNKSEAGGMQLNKQPLDVAQLIQSAFQNLKFSAEESQITLKSRVPTDLPEVQGDREKLERVLINLVANAIQHSSSGGRVVCSVGVLPNGKAVEFCVEDRGCGIPEEFLKAIFEKFSVVEGRNRGLRSCGLGLAFCKKVVDAHGGEISVTSEKNLGSNFRFTLPL